jgi:hypothetical protein
MKVEGLWSFSLRPLQSQKLPVPEGISDPLYKPLQPSKIVEAILSSASSVVACWEGLLAEVETEKYCVILTLREEKPPPVSCASWNESPTRDEASYIAAEAERAGKRLEDLSQTDLTILKRSFAENNSYRKECSAAVGPSPFQMMDYSKPIPEPALSDG